MTESVQEFKEKLSKCKSLGQIGELAKSITDDHFRRVREQAVVDAAMHLLECPMDVALLAKTFSFITGRHLAIQEYAREKGFDTMDQAISLLPEIKGFESGGFEATQAIMRASKKFITPDQNTSIEDLQMMATLCLIDPISDHEIPTNDIAHTFIHAALPKMENFDTAISIIEKIACVPILHRMLIAYIDHYGITDFTQAEKLKGFIKFPMFFGTQARKTLFSAITPLMEITPHTNMDDLCNIAAFVEDDSGTGRYSREKEDQIIYAALALATNIDQVIKLAEQFSTNSGCHRFLMMYARKHPIDTKLVANKLCDLVRGPGNFGQEAIGAIVDKAQENGVEISVDQVIDKKKSQETKKITENLGVLGAILPLSGVSVGTTLADLDKELEKLFTSGKLGGIEVNGMTLDDYLLQHRQELPPELLRILEKYVKH